MAACVLLLAAGSSAWYLVLTWTPSPSGPDALAATPGAGEEICEFLARPAAKLYIDGKLATEEIPPLYRTALPVGEHKVRFESPAGEAREITISVTRDRPTQWFVNFVDGRVHRRDPVSVSR